MPTAADSAPDEGRARAGGLDRLPESLALAGLVAAPLLFGAIDGGVIAGLAALFAVALAVAAAGGRRLRPGLFAAALGVVAAFVAVQLVPLPPGLLALVAPQTREVLTFVLPAELANAWHPISLDPPSTARELARAAGLFALAFVLHHRTTASPHARGRTLAAVAIAGTAAAAIGLSHRLLGLDALFGVWALKTDTPLVSVVANANHLAGLANLSGFIALGLALEAEEWRPRLAWSASALACAATSWLSVSGGGRVALLASLVVLAILRIAPVQEERGSDAPPPRGFFDRRATFVVACLLIFAPLAVIYSGVPLVKAKELLPAEFLASKAEPLRIGIALARAQPLVGVGRGAFETTHTRFMSVPAKVTYTHAENELVQGFAELGVVIGAVFAVALLAALFSLLRQARRSALEAGAAAGAFALLLQSAADFSLHYAAGFLLVAVLARVTRHQGTGLATGRTGSLAVAALTLLLVGVGAARQSDLSRDGAVLTAWAAEADRSIEEVERAAGEAFAKHPADYLPADVAATRHLREPSGAKGALPWLNKLLFLAPLNGRAHYLAAEAMARLGRRDQALAEYRLAAEYGFDTMARVRARFPDDDAAVLAGAPRGDATSALRAANALEAAKAPALARAVAANALELVPDDVNLTDFLVRRLGPEGENARAIELARALRTRRPELPHAWYLETIALFDAKKTEDARRLLDEGIAAHPESEALALAAAQLEFALGRNDAALQALLRFPIGAPPAAREQYHLLRGTILRGKNQLDGALTEFHLALSLAPDNVDTALRLAECHLALERFSEAEGVLSRLDAKDPRVGPQLDALRKRRDAQRERVRAIGLDSLLGGQGQ